MKYVKYVFVLLLASSLFGVEVRASWVPLYEPFGDPEKIHFDPLKKEYVDETRIYDNWMIGLPRAQYLELTQPRHIPAHREYHIAFTKKVYRKPELLYAQAALLGISQRKRLVLINVEQNPNYEPQYRIYLHLGILYVGTAASREGWDVVLWDELIQGHADLEKLVQPGDVVGLSMIITGAERAIDLARKAKEVGASCVIAGNDSAIFRSNQILSLPGKPIDAVFTSNSLNSLRMFFQQFDGSNLGTLAIPEMATSVGGTQHSNHTEQLLIELKDRKAAKDGGTFDNEDGFIIPDFSLYPVHHWERAWNNYRAVYGHKHRDQTTVRNAIGLLAQGCTRTQGTTACSYCTIFGIGDIRVPSEEYLAATLDAYRKFGITAFFNVTDSAYEMVPLITKLERTSAKFEALTVYGRAQGLTLHPQYLDRWLGLVNSRLLINVGMDSGDDQMLLSGVDKSSVPGKGSRLEENREAVRRIRDSGAHLHYSMIFGSPGESRESCERTLDFIQWSADTLGDKLDIAETDLYWLNFGSPASEVFHNFAYAEKLAAAAGKIITRDEWYRDFASRRDDLIVSWETERNWYRYFTKIDLDTAQAYNQRASEIMTRLTGSISGRAFNPLEES
jgi:Radical SAM superfamily